MRSQRIFLRKHWQRPTSNSPSPLSLSNSASRHSRSARLPPRNNARFLATGASIPPPYAEASSQSAPLEEEKTRRRGNGRISSRGLPPPPELSGPLLPVVLTDNLTPEEILWHPEYEGSEGAGPPPIPGLPKPWLVQKALFNLSLTLHPQTQHRATYPTASGGPLEPTLALYCPIEGGDYVIDATVREIATKAGAEVLVIDAAHLAAGEWGKFGKAASSLHFPQNPLHFSNSSAPRSSDEDDDDDGPPHVLMNNSPMFSIQIPSSLQVATGFRSPRIGSGASTARGPSSSKAEAFFDDLVNLSAPSALDANGVDLESPKRPRIIYIRDFSTIASSAPSWWPALLAAVRSRRQGPISRPSSSVTNPTTIIFGITPPLFEHPPPTPPSPPAFLSMLMGNRPPPSAKPVRQDTWDEEDHRARERRLKERVKKWERGDAWIREELPKFNNSPGSSTGGGMSGVGVVMGGKVVQLPGGGRMMIDGGSLREDDEAGGSGESDGYFRIVGLVPAERDLAQERNARLYRRQEINELVLRMAVGSVGGALAQPTDRDGDLRSLMEEWGKRLQEWGPMKEIADGALAWTLHNTGEVADSSSLNPTEVPWFAVNDAWEESRFQKRFRKDWVEESAASGRREFVVGEGEAKETEEDSADEGAAEDESYDEVIENIKRDPDLDPHEQRLLGCIVNTASMPTTFASVHLPPATIDSVRTLVSLPLLYPDAFTQGILKTHTMTGALLFGPPGTGKTLVVRALARESGARMMIIKPSDVMDMYVGEGEKLVRSVFTLARRLSPCVVFLDEIDALFGARVSTRESGGAIAHRGVITEFMQEMDGLKTGREGNVIVIGATNRPFDLDDAVLRRLPRRLLVDLPGEKEREEILKILLRDETLAEDLDLHTLAKRTESFSGSDLKHLCVSAALDAVKETVDLPWMVPEKPSASSTESSSPSEVDPSPSPEASFTTAAAADSDAPNPSKPRILSLRHFTKALKEITPSASESLGTLADLRKWNEEFGEGSRRKRKNWGDRFGFGLKGGEEGRVAKESLITPVGP